MYGNFRRAMTISGDRPLSDDEIRNVAPSVFAAGPHESRSEKYTYIPTIQILEGLRNEGFQPFLAGQGRCRKEDKRPFTKHIIRLRQESTSAYKEEACEIILINSHDGTSSYQMHCGMFRFVCMNGMVIGDIIETIRVMHKGDIVSNVVEAAYTMADHFENAIGSVERMKEIKLSREEALMFAKKALAIKYGEKQPPIEHELLLSPRRDEDSKDKSIWTNFNVIQENLIRGGLRGVSATGRHISTRPVRSIDTDIKLNRALWTLAEEFVISEI